MKELLGEELRSSKKIDALLQELVTEVQSHSEKLGREVRPPQPEKAGAAKKLFDETGKVRGRPLFYNYIGSGLGNGPYVELVDGSVKLDLINGIGIHITGHSHPDVIRAAARGALSDIVMQGNLEPNREYYEVGSTLVRLASRKSRLRHVWLSTCGTMANENALKACRQKRTPAKMIVAMNAAFAGRSTLMAEVTDNPNLKEGLPTYSDVVRVPFYDKKDPRSAEKSLAKLKEHAAKFPNDIACFTFEPVQGEGGFNVAPREFFLPMLEFCREQKIAVWVDEVQTFMRTGEFFAFETLDIGDYVDVCTVAKTLQNGATFFTEDYNPKPGLISGTFSGSGATLSAGLEILRLLENGGYMGATGKVAGIHKDFVAMLNRLNETTCKGLLQDAGGLGLMVAVTPLDGSKEKVGALLKKLFENGLIAFNCGRGPYRLRFLLPIVLNQHDIEVAARIIEKSVQELA